MTRDDIRLATRSPTYRPIERGHGLEHADVAPHALIAIKAIGDRGLRRLLGEGARRNSCQMKVSERQRRHARRSDFTASRARARMHQATIRRAFASYRRRGVDRDGDASPL